MADQSKTEKATGKRRKDERKKGNVFQSKDVITAASLIIMFFTLKLWGPYILTSSQKLIIDYIGRGVEVLKVTDNDIRLIISNIFISSAIMTTPVLLVSMATTVIFTGIQTKFIFTGETVKFKLSKLNPVAGIKKLFSARSMVELLKSAIKIIIIGAILYSNYKKLVKDFPLILEMDFFATLNYVCARIFSIVMNISIAYVFVALADYMYQWWEYEKNLKMSKQEVKEEYKMLEGDPQIKAKIKERQRKMAMSRMMQAVPTADVVIKNPTHFAVAIKYEVEKNRAPVVVAKGQDKLALKIIEIAEKNDVYVMENRPLARALFETVELEPEIPPQFFKQVAEVLAFVYNLKKKDLTKYEAAK